MQLVVDADLYLGPSHVNNSVDRRHKGHLRHRHLLLACDIHLAIGVDSHAEDVVWVRLIGGAVVFLAFLLDHGEPVRYSRRGILACAVLYGLVALQLLVLHVQALRCRLGRRVIGLDCGTGSEGRAVVEVSYLQFYLLYLELLKFEVSSCRDLVAALARLVRTPRLEHVVDH